MAKNYKEPADAARKMSQQAKASSKLHSDDATHMQKASEDAATDLRQRQTFRKRHENFSHSARISKRAR